MCSSIGNQRFGVVRNTRRPTRSASATNRALPLPVADVLDHGVREDDVEGPVGKREGTRVALDVGDLRIPLAEPDAVVQPERGDPLAPGIELLEEVVRPAARLASGAAEADLVGADVEHRGRRGRAHLVEEEPQLPAARPERDGIDEIHPREGTGRRRCSRPRIEVGVAQAVVENVVTPTRAVPPRPHVPQPHLARAPLADGTTATAWQRLDGRVVVRAEHGAGLEQARFMLALHDDTTEFHRRFARDPAARRRPFARSSATGRCGSRPSRTRRCARCAAS